MAHPAPHPDAGRVRLVTTGLFEGARVEIIDWYDRVSQKSWREAGHDPRAHRFSERAAYARLPCDDEVVLARLTRGEALFHVEEFSGPQAIEVQP